jgi:hypothetical protein
MRFKNGSHYGGHFGSYFQYGRQNTYKISKCSNAPITKNIDICFFLEECGRIFFRILPNFELMLEIPNIMLVCKFEINWSTNKNLRALTT